MTIAMGVDAALGSTGIAVMNINTDDILGIRKIRTTKKKATPTESKRLEQIFEELNLLIDYYKPDILVIENQHVNELNKKTGLGLSRVRGVIQLAATLKGIPVYTFEPSEIKKSVTGKGNAKKEKVQEDILALYDYQPIVQQELSTIILTGANKTDDMADALAIVHTYKVQPAVAVPA